MAVDLRRRGRVTERQDRRAEFRFRSNSAERVGAEQWGVSYSFAEQRSAAVRRVKEQICGLVAIDAVSALSFAMVSLVEVSEAFVSRL